MTARGARSTVVPVLILALVALPLPYVLRFDHSHTMTAVLLALLLIAIALRSRESGIVVILLYLLFLGDYRRLAGYFQGYTLSDPLLLVAPIAAFFLWCLTFLDKGNRGHSRLAMLIGLLAVLMAAEIFNPRQGGIAVGISGALFYFVPLMWFWIGSAYGDEEFVYRLFTKTLLPVALIAALYGIYQAVYGLLPFAAAWAETIRFEALYIGEGVRPLSFFTSSAEYLRYLLIASVFVYAMWLKERSRYAFVLPVLLAALFLGSARGPIVMVVLTATLLWAVFAQRRVLWLPRLVIAGGAGLAVLAAVLLAAQNLHLSSRLDYLLAHQVEGLLDPTNPEKSTATGHASLALEGLEKGITSLAGNGLGAATIAASKYGEGVYNAELDISNMFYSLGVIGGLMYVAIVAIVLARALANWRRRRSVTALGVLGIAACTLGTWLFGGEYAVSALVWFCFGSVNRVDLEMAGEQRRRTRDAHRLSHA